MIDLLDSGGQNGIMYLAYSGGAVSVGNKNTVYPTTKLSINYSSGSTHYGLYAQSYGPYRGFALEAVSQGTSTATNYAGAFYSTGSNSGSNIAIYAEATKNYSIYASGQNCGDGSGDPNACSLNDIVELWHSAESLEQIECDENSKWGDPAQSCRLPEDFKPEFHDGDVVCALEGKKNTLIACNEKYDKSAIGVISENPTVVLGGAGPYKVSLLGNVPVNVICNVPIEVGDLLVYSGINNYAMKFQADKKMSYEKYFELRHGVFAKALESCDDGIKK